MFRRILDSLVTIEQRFYNVWNVREKIMAAEKPVKTAVAVWRFWRATEARNE